MGQALRRIQSKKKAKDQLTKLIDHSEHVVVIHYACEGFYDRYNKATPRVTSIAVRNLHSGQTQSFSIHQIAERENVHFDKIEENYDNLEKKMLDDFYEYVKKHETCIWLHWNMRDMNFGFQAIAHRYKILKGKPIDVIESNLVNLSQLLMDIYSINYIQHQRLPSLVYKNNLKYKDFLTGEEEAKAFEKKDYIRLHQSTLRKVKILSNFAKMTDKGTLLTNTTLISNFRNYPAAFGELIQEHWLIGIIFLLGAIASILALVLT